MRDIRRCVVRPVLALLAAVLCLPALAGCAAVGAVGHVRGLAETSAGLATALQRLPGVASTTARYLPLDPAGESLRVSVAMTADASVADWRAAVVALHRSLTAAPLQDARQSVDVRGRAADLAFDGVEDWPDAVALGALLDRWGTVRQRTGLPLRLIHAARGGPSTVIETASGADAAAFVADARGLGALLRGVTVSGPGFAGVGPMPKGFPSLYRAALRTHAAAPTTATGRPAVPFVQLTWNASSVSVALAGPGSTASAADLAVIGALSGVTSVPSRTASWTNGRTVASVDLTRCAGRRIAGDADRALAAALAAAHRPLRPPAGPGVCGG